MEAPPPQFEPTESSCDGVDSDCDGEVDEADDLLEAGAVGEPCGPDVGLCGPGRTACADRETVCLVDHWPRPERCDGVDDDCDGLIDEVYDVGGACVSGVGDCAVAGVTVCAEDGEGIACAAAPLEPGQERCDGRDNDCDGQIDELPDLVEQGRCGSDVGECSPGEWICHWGQLFCSGERPPREERCSGRDEDCDGEIDEEDGRWQLRCTQRGVCEGTVPFCEGEEMPPRFGCEYPDSYEARVEVSCDGLDNDCDGHVDENLTPALCPLQVGVCAGAMNECRGALGWSLCDAAEYRAQHARYEVDELSCDALDNDCDGAVDEGLDRPGCGEDECLVDDDCEHGRCGLDGLGFRHCCPAGCDAPCRACTADGECIALEDAPDPLSCATCDERGNPKPLVIAVESRRGNLHRSDDGGDSWTSLRLPGGAWRVAFADRLHGWYAGGPGPYQRTADGGDSWRRMFDGAPQQGGDNLSAWGLDELWDVDGRHNIYWTLDRGRTWHSQRASWPADIVRTEAGVVVVANSPGLLVSDNLGESWEQTEGLPQDRYTHVAAAGPHVAACSSGDPMAVVWSHDSGRTWAGELLDDYRLCRSAAVLPDGATWLSVTSPDGRTAPVLAAAALPGPWQQVSPTAVTALHMATHDLGFALRGVQVVRTEDGGRTWSNTDPAGLAWSDLTIVDQAAPVAWHRDADGDGWGARDDVTYACEPPPGYVADEADCDDDDDTISPSDAELCADVVDNDCDNELDEAECEWP